VLCVISGGLDSTVLAYKLEREFALDFVSFDYGQRHGQRELWYAGLTAERMGVTHDIVKIPDLGAFLPSALTDQEVSVPHGHYASEQMRSTVVPNRNAIMLSIAAAIAAGREIPLVSFAAHSGDHYIYPDCRPEFVDRFNRMLLSALEGSVAVIAPFLNQSKTDIVVEGAILSVPFASTWSCYEGGEYHCGKCGTCYERREAFQQAGVEDPTIYEE
jgi:7-cyano-7-deazaguanine synthase